MQETLVDHLRSCCVRVLGQKPGCGFFIAPQLLVTCSHVVGREARKDSEIYLERWSNSLKESTLRGTVLANFSQEDVAFISTSEPNDSFAPLSKEIQIGHQLTAVGFPSVDGLIAFDQFTAQYEGQTWIMGGDGRARTDTKFKSGQVESGYSGGPLLNLETSKVVGIVALSRDRYTDLGGWAIEVPVVERLLHESYQTLPVIDSGWVKAASESPEENTQERCSSLQEYKDWLERTTSEFIVPTIEKDFSISEDWIEREVARKQGGRKYIDAEVAAEIYSHILLRGSSGSGKSTLMRRLANSFTSIGKVVLYVNLSEVFPKYQRGDTFGKAIILTAIDGSNIEYDDVASYIGSPEYLIADGLDECGNNSAEVEKKLSDWAKGHPDTKVIVSCRDGVVTESFHAWEHLDVLPLSQSEVVRFSNLVIDKLLPLREEKERAMKVVRGVVDDSKMFGLLKDSPLFIGFIARLASADRELGNFSKTEIYTASVDLAYQHRTQREQGIEISKLKAMKILGLVGQKLQRDLKTTEDELIEYVVGELERSGCTFYEADTIANQGIEFWKKRRVLTQHRASHKGAVRFVHYSLCEYAAGYHASKLSQDELCVWLKESLSESSYQDVVYFASGLGAGNRIIQHILSNSCDTPEASHMLIAKIILASDEISESSIATVITDVVPELKSFDVRTVLDCLEVLSKISQKNRDLVYSAVSPLLNNDQLWTRAVAVAVAASCYAEGVNMDLMMSTLREVLLKRKDNTRSTTPLRKEKGIEFPANLFSPSSTESVLANQVVVSICKSVLDSDADVHITSQVADIVLSGKFALDTYTTLHKKLIVRIQKAIKELGWCDKNQWYALMSKALERDLNFSVRSLSLRAESFQRTIETKRSDKVFLESIIRVIEDSEVDIKLESFLNMIALGKLLYSMHVPVMTEKEWTHIGKSEDTESLDIVLKGMIPLLVISPSRLISEAKSALDDVERFFSYDLEEIKTLLQQDTRGGMQYYETDIYKDRACSDPLYSQVADTSILVNRRNASTLNISPQSLVRSFQHPSQCVYWNAALLVKYGAGGDEAVELAKECVGEEQWLKFESRKSDSPR